jgi:cytochrome c peroxidase
MKTTNTIVLGSLALLAMGAASDASYTDAQLRALYNRSVRYVQTLAFPSFVNVGDPIAGKAEFGVSPDDQSVDITPAALFQGPSVIAGNVVSNGTGCATCHRPDSNFMLPPPPLSAHIPPTDAFWAGRNSEAQGDPRSASILDNHGLFKIRMNRFNPTLPDPSPFRSLFGWRKTQTIFNMALSNGLLTDLRARGAVEQARGAAFTHTQDGDVRFDDLVNPHLNDIVAYQETELRPAALQDLLDPTAANYQTLVNDPFATVPITTEAQREGKEVFVANCMGCHNMPNVFGNLDHQEGAGPNYPPVYGHPMDIGVAQRNKHGLDFRAYDATTGQYSTIVLPLAREDGRMIMWSVTDDVGTAGTTGRYEDLHRFKVPQLRMVSKLAPYFHDNSAATLEEVVDYFNSDDYNGSADGRSHPIHLDREERANLLAFLQIL